MKSTEVATVLLVAAASYVTFLVFRKYSKRPRWRKVGIVEELFIHPIKSCRGISVDQADATPHGPTLGRLVDRQFMLVSSSADDGGIHQMITAREEPRMVLIEPFIDSENILTLSCKGAIDSPSTVDSIKVNLDTVENSNVNRRARMFLDMIAEGIDCGDDSAQWICQVLGSEVDEYRLIWLCPSRVNYRQTNLDAETGCEITEERLENTTYTDLVPYLITNHASVDDLNTKLPDDSKVTNRNFRSNVVVRGDIPPYAEDKWKYVRIGDAVFVTVCPCTRCRLTTVDPETGKKHPRQEPLNTLNKYRRLPNSSIPAQRVSPLFGINMALDIPGRIAVNDDVFAAL